MTSISTGDLSLSYRNKNMCDYITLFSPLSSRSMYVQYFIDTHDKDVEKMYKFSSIFNFGIVFFFIMKTDLLTAVSLPL